MRGGFRDVYVQPLLGMIENTDSYVSSELKPPNQIQCMHESPLFSMILPRTPDGFSRSFAAANCLPLRCLDLRGETFGQPLICFKSLGSPGKRRNWSVLV